MEKILIANKIKTPDGTILHSKHRHDFVCHIDKVNDEKYCLDGGNDYKRIIFERTVPIDCSIYSTDDFEIVRENLLRGTYGKDGNEKIRYIPLCEMEDEHILNCIKYVENSEDVYDADIFTILELYHKELEYRFDRNIQI